MTLNDSEYKAFLITHIGLLYYVGQRKGIVPPSMSMKGFIADGLISKSSSRDLFHQTPSLLDDYLAENEGKLTDEQVEILSGFKEKIAGTFVIYKCYTNHAIFIETKTNKFYAVKALRDRFDDFFDTFPTLVDAVILPFKGKIIYDGFFKAIGMGFGAGIRASMNDDYRKAKKKNRIIMRL